MSDIDIKKIWDGLRDSIIDKPIEEMTALEIVERLGVFQFIAYKATQESEKLQKETMKIMDIKAQG